MRMLTALVTYAGLPDLAPDDRLLRNALEERGATAEAVVWDDPRADWSRFDAVIVRSTWDYHKRIDEFRAWIDRMEAANVPLWNPPPLLRWNTHKRYLLDLAANVVPSVLVPRGSPIDTRDWMRVVVKPAVSATAWKTICADANALRGVLAEEDLLVQPFLEEVRASGEWSLVFIAGELSHAVIKRPRADDFRVQTDFGGTVEDAIPSDAVVEQAKAILRMIEWPWLYARVDGIVRDGTLLLMELEMTEPSLFLANDPNAAARLADAIVHSLRSMNTVGYGVS